jgi:hypothetical protein
VEFSVNGRLDNKEDVVKRKEEKGSQNGMFRLLVKVGSEKGLPERQLSILVG